MKLHRIRAVILRHIYEARRNLDRLIDTLYWPVLDIVVWGFFTIFLAHDKKMASGVMSLLLGAIILWGLFYSVQRDMAVGFIDELWSRNLINLFSSPLSMSEYVTGLITVNLIKAAIGMSAAGAIAWACYAFDVFPMLPAFLPFMINLVLFALAIGVMITGLILRYTTKIQGLAWSFAGLLMPMSCVLYPVSTLPKSLRPFAEALPTMHSFEGMRQILNGGGFSSSHFYWGLALNAGYFAVAIVFFRWMFEAARSRGLLVKLE